MDKYTKSEAKAEAKESSRHSKIRMTVIKCNKTNSYFIVGEARELDKSDEIVAIYKNGKLCNLEEETMTQTQKIHELIKSFRTSLRYVENGDSQRAHHILEAGCARFISDALGITLKELSESILELKDADIHNTLNKNNS